MMIDLNVIADTLGIHPRTVLRAITGEENPYWTANYNPLIDVEDVVDFFGCTKKQFVRLMKGEDLLMSPAEACEFLRISKRTLRYRRSEGEVTPIVARGSVVRYSREHLLEREFNKAAL